MLWVRAGKVGQKMEFGARRIDDQEERLSGEGM